MLMITITLKMQDDDVYMKIMKTMHVLFDSEKLGYFSSHPGLSCKHIRDFEDSCGDGEYWIDPEKNGNPLKVFCDLTTDGGKFLTNVFS